MGNFPKKTPYLTKSETGLQYRNGAQLSDIDLVWRIDELPDMNIF